MSDTILSDAPLLPSVTQQQNGMEWNIGWGGLTSTAIPPPFAYDIVGQHNKIGGITFRGAPLFK